MGAGSWLMADFVPVGSIGGDSVLSRRQGEALEGGGGWEFRLSFWR